MNLPFKLPDLGEGITEGEVVEWHVAVGDYVEEDAPMVEVMTDKTTVTIGAPKAGVVQSIHVAVGEVASVGSVLLVLATSEESAGRGAQPTQEQEATQSETAASGKAEGPAATAVGDLRDVLPGASYFQDKVPASSTPAARASAAPEGAGTYFNAKPIATPAIRALAKELGVDLRAVLPTGTGGRVQESDLREHAARAHASTGQSDEIRKPFVGLRRKIADKLQQSNRSAVHYTFVEELDVEPLIARRDALSMQAQAAGVKLTYLPFIVKAVTRALRAHPMLNSYLDESRNELVTRSALHVGVAAATDAGLVVPVLRHADRLGVLELAVEIDRLGRGAREGTLSPEELMGSTFTITSLGKLGGLLATPVLNYPEVGILGVHRIKDKPVIRHGSVVPGKLMMLSWSFDHRIIDGHEGASFAYTILDALEHPETL